MYPDSVFWYGIGWYFLGIFLTDTEGKLGKDLTTARQASWAFLAGIQKLAFLFLPSQMETPHA
jgi:hypothetical protein